MKTDVISLVRFDEPTRKSACFGANAHEFYLKNRRDLRRLTIEPGVYEIRINKRFFGLIETYYVQAHWRY